MPLRDHFRPPLASLTSWDGFHGQWPAMIVLGLFDKLPKGYVASPHVHLGREIEVDVASYENDWPNSLPGPESNGNGDVAIWIPTRPTLTVETDLANLDEYEVRVYDVERGRRLVAAMEIVSPANKDRPEHRRVFVAKCAALLRQQVSVVIVDLVTTRNFNLYTDLLELIGRNDPSLGSDPSAVYVASCRWTETDRGGILQTWAHALTLGQPLPTLPLWLTDDLSVPLELEKSYEETCRVLRIA